MNDNPHDNFVRESFGRIEIARDFIRNYAPPELIAQIDLDTLESVDGTFVDQDLQISQSDMLFRVNSLLGELLLYFLFEHKSFGDYASPLQLLRYIVRVWEKEPKPTAKRKLTPILPFIIYHGESRWHVSPQFSDTVQSVTGLQQFTPNFEYIVLDLSPKSDAEIRGTILLRLFLSILNIALDPQSAHKLPNSIILINELLRQNNALDYIKTVLNYLAKGARYLEHDELVQIYTKHSADHGDFIMSIAQQWIDQGKEIGKEIGKVEEQHENIISILNVRFNRPLKKQTYTHLARITNLSQLRTLRDLALTTSSFENFSLAVATMQTNGPDGVDEMHI